MNTKEHSWSSVSTWMLLIPAVLIALALLCCEPAVVPAANCTPNEEIVCNCVDTGTEGWQTCNAEGTAYSACNCGGSGGGGAGSDASSTASSTSSTTGAGGTSGSAGGAGNDKDCETDADCVSNCGPLATLGCGCWTNPKNGKQKCKPKCNTVDDCPMNDKTYFCNGTYCLIDQGAGGAGGTGGAGS